MKITRELFLRILGTIAGSAGLISPIDEKFWKTNNVIDRPKNFQVELDIIQGKAYNKSTPTNTSNYWLQFSDASNTLYHHIAGQAFNLLDKREDEISQLNTLSEWKSRQEKTKNKLINIVGPFPKKTVLNATVTKVIDKGSYRVEHVIYESRPGFYVTSSLFIPEFLNKPAPAIIYTSGHTGAGYRYDVYQHVILNLVKKGFVVFAFDPVGQGERRQYSHESGIRGTTKEHSYGGAQLFITGSNLAQYMVWDGIRAVDYLLTRDEVDSAHIGITGRSGGGMQAAYIAAMDDRISAAAPECYLTSFRRLFQSIGPQDAEQNLPAAIAEGIDEADLLSVRAPKPSLMITTTRDIFSIQGARETAMEVSKIYKSYSVEDNFGKVEDDANHTSTKKNREAKYAFFQQHLDNSGSPDDHEIALLSDQELQVTRTGQISTSLEGETVFSLNRREAKKLADKLQASRKNIGRHLPKVINAAKNLSGYQDPVSIEKPVFTGRYQKDGYAIEKYFVKGEGEYPIPYLLLVPNEANSKALIYLNGNTKTDYLQNKEWFVQKGFTVLAPDLLGVGEMEERDFQGDSYIGNTSYNIWYASILISRSLVGIQAGDIVRLGRLLRRRLDISSVYGFARQHMAPALLHAAAFDLSIARIALIEPYSSYQSIVMNRLYKSSFIHSTVGGALTAYDLPDLAAGLAPRKLLITDATDELGKKINSETTIKNYGVVSAAYRYKNADSELNIISNESVKDRDNIYMRWIR